MSRCLDEARLQSYFDGELSIELMESVTSHLASCVTCAAAARELEEETALLTTALSAEFEASVPTERLRQRIDAAVLGERVAIAQAPEKQSGLAAFFNGFLNFGTQRTLGYASLAVVIAFGAIVGVVMMRTETTVAPQNTASTPSKSAEVKADNTPSVPIQSKETVAISETPNVSDVRPDKRKTPPRRIIEPTPATLTAAAAPPVKLLPGERSYLQTIARLDSTIKSNSREMRPSLRSEYERNLAVVDRAIAATRSAAKSNPNDPDAADFMFAAYQSKVDLLNTIADARVSNSPRH
ncbi:MAG TPA: zf-HC2 domain-containing protein [Pyrinomonadaceae bacterium]|nr:zf-HC2 domain-containing protein [Pyrinomonadaceae bacterium]